MPAAQYHVSARNPGGQVISVANYKGNSITSYPATSHGHRVPTSILSGSLTQIIGPLAVDLDPVGNIAVLGLNIVNIFPAGSNGNVPPIHQIAGPATLINTAESMTIDHRGHIFVAGESMTIVHQGNIFVAGSASQPYILEFSGLEFGNVAPIAVIQGSNTGLGAPAAMTVDASDNIYVANAGQGTAILGFKAGSNGNIKPFVNISGSNTCLQIDGGIAIDQLGNIFVTCIPFSPRRSSILEFAAGANGNATPIAVISGPNTKLNNPSGVAIDAEGRIYGLDYVSNSIEVFAQGANGDVKPVQRILDPHARLRRPIAVIVH